MKLQAQNSHLLRKLLSVLALAIALALVIVWVAIDFFAVDYFAYLLDKYNVPKKQEVMQMFLDSVHRSLVWAGLAALAFASLLGFWLIRMVLRPLYDMVVITGKIARGDYTAKVQIASEDEIGQLGKAFNSMTEKLNRVEQLRKKWSSTWRTGCARR